MKITIEKLREIIHEVSVGASAEYMKKERVREVLQQAVAGMVASGEITSQQDLDSAFSAVDMSVNALKMIPFEVWRKLAGSPSPKPTKKPSRREL